MSDNIFKRKWFKYLSINNRYPESNVEEYYDDPAEFKEKVSSSAEPIEKKPVDKRNTLNDLNGTEWLPATKSYMYQKGLDRKL